MEVTEKMFCANYLLVVLGITTSVYDLCYCSLLLHFMVSVFQSSSLCYCWYSCAWN